MNKRKITAIVGCSIALVLIILLIVIKTKTTSDIPKDDITNKNDLIENNIQEEQTIKYTSPKGYEIEYVAEKIQLTIEDQKDKYVYIASEDEDSENEIYFAVTILENENNTEIKNNLIATADMTGDCKITQANLEGVYTEKENGKLVIQNLIFELDENKMVLIEISKEKEENNYIKNMIKTFKIN